MFEIKFIQIQIQSPVSEANTGLIAGRYSEFMFAESSETKQWGSNSIWCCEVLSLIPFHVDNLQHLMKTDRFIIILQSSENQICFYI